jgi:hypothetical protein
MPRRLLLAVCAVALVPVLGACGDDAGDDGALAADSPSPTQPPAHVSTASPMVAKPASKYSVSIDDIGLAWLTDIRGTFVIDSVAYGKTPRLFPSEADGKQLLAQWGYLEGYETAYIPEGRDQAVLNGSYYITVETHLFADATGAASAFDYFLAYRTNSGATPVTIQPVGNKSAAFFSVLGTIADTKVAAAYHQVVLQRGNALTVVLTKGAQGFMDIKPAWGLATISDEKLLGERAAPEPTPVSNFKTPTPTPKP